MEDVLLVLGYSTDPDDPVFQARVDKAVALYTEGVAPQIIMSGCCSMKLERKPRFTEAEVMKDYAVERGLPPSAILLEEQSVDSLGNFYFTKVNYLIPCSWHHVGVVSTPWHAWRSEWLAEQVLGPDFDVTSYPSEQPDGWDEKMIKRSELTNRTLLAETQEMLKGIEPGDHEAIARFLGKTPPG